MIREGSLRDGYWVSLYDFGYLVGNVVGTNYFGEVSLEADGVYRYSKTSFVPITQHVRTMKSGDVEKQWPVEFCFLGGFPSGDRKTPLLMKSLVDDIDSLLWRWDAPRTSLTGDKHPHLSLLGQVLDGMVGDDLAGILAFHSWTSRQLVESVARAFPPEEQSPQRDSVVAALLHTLALPRAERSFACRRGAGYLLDFSGRSPSVREDPERALEMLDEFDALVSRGYPEEWADKTARCRVETSD